MQDSGTPSNLQRDIVPGPLSRLGLNTRTIYGTQGKKHICDIMDHGSIYTTTGHHMRYLTEAQNLETAIHQQLPRLIPVYQTFLDRPHMAIHDRKETIYRRNYGSPSTSKIERLVYFGRPDGHGDQREMFFRYKNI